MTRPPFATSRPQASRVRAGLGRFING
jgi:hypothetical protein